MSVDLPGPQEIKPFLSDSECFDIAAGVEARWPHLKADGGFFLKDDGSPADHHWNRSPQGVIVDATARQFGSADFIITPDHHLHGRYVSYEYKPQEAQRLAHRVGHHWPAADYQDCCPLCVAQASEA